MTEEDAVGRAERYLSTAELVREDGDLETCVSRAYYAMFYVARELLQWKDVETGTHQGLVNQFGLHFVKEGPLETRYGQMLREMQELREFAEYAEERVVTQEDADTALQNAEEFVEEVGKLLRSS